jgi:hypothetical protein
MAPRCFFRALTSPVSEEKYLKLLQLSYANNVYITSISSGSVQCCTWCSCLAVAKPFEFLNTVACYKLTVRSGAAELCVTNSRSSFLGALRLDRKCTVTHPTQFCKFLGTSAEYLPHHVPRYWQHCALVR